MRLIITSLSHVEEQHSWLMTLKASDTFFEDVVFMLGNSANGRFTAFSIPNI